MAAQQKPEPGTAVAVNEARPYALKSPIAELLQSEKAMAIIGPMVPHGVNYRQVISEVYRAGTKDPQILNCTPTSIIDAVSTVVQTGLVVGKTIFLVPQRTKVSARGEPDKYEQRLQAWTHYVGDIELVVRSGAARHVVGEAVYAGDQFAVRLGMDPHIEHVPTIDPSKRGALIGAYSIAYLNSAWTQKKVTWVPLADVEKVRKSSKSWSPEKVTMCPDWYAIKTAIRRNCKTLPKNERLAKVLAIFEREDSADRGDGEIDATSYTLSPALPRERTSQLMPGAPSDAPYELDASGGVQADDVEGQPAPARTAAQRAVAATASQMASPYGEPSEPAFEFPNDDEPTAPTSTASCERFLVPNGLGPNSGKPLGALLTVDLEQLYRWALKQKEGKYPGLSTACEELLELRRNGDAQEPVTATAE